MSELTLHLVKNMQILWMKTLSVSILSINFLFQILSRVSIWQIWPAESWCSSRCWHTEFAEGGGLPRQGVNGSKLPGARNRTDESLIGLIGVIANPFSIPAHWYSGKFFPKNKFLYFIHLYEYCVIMNICLYYIYILGIKRLFEGFQSIYFSCCGTMYS